MSAFHDFTRPRALVTGAAGFLGSHLCDALVARGYDVVGLDNYFTGRKENVAHLLGNPNFEMVRHDVRLAYWGEFDEIYHLACPASPRFYQRNAIATAKISFLGSHLCDALVARGYDVVGLDSYFTGHKENVASRVRRSYSRPDNQQPKSRDERRENQHPYALISPYSAALCISVQDRGESLQDTLVAFEECLSVISRFQINGSNKAHLC
jgi:nucleoside-diphosphate-sugar epimerase